MTAFIQTCAGDPSFEKYKSPFEDVDDVQKRCVLLHASVVSMVRLPDGTLPGRQRLEMNFQLSAFVRGDRLSVNPAPNPPSKPKETWSDIRGLIGYDNVLWEMKFRKPMPYRLLGVMAEKDTFVGLSLHSRVKLDWKQACSAALAQYYALLGSDPCNAVKSYNATDALSNWRIPS